MAPYRLLSGRGTAEMVGLISEIVMGTEAFGVWTAILLTGDLARQAT